MAPPGPSAIPLSSMTTDCVCEQLQQIEGIDPTMLVQYSATIKKANISGRVLTQCNLDELKKEMDMNFGDWHLFKEMVTELRHGESQVLHEGLQAAGGQDGGTVAPGKTTTDHETVNRCSLSFEDLSNLGLDEPHKLSDSHWSAIVHRTTSMSSLNSQESSSDICKLTDKQQEEYRDAYREYIAQMAQLEGGEPTPPDSQDRVGEADQEAHEPTDVSGPSLEPIAEEEEKPQSQRTGPFPELNSEEEESGTEYTDCTPLLKEEKRVRVKVLPAARLSSADLDKKASSDSGLRSSDSSPEHSPRDEKMGPPRQLAGPALIELERETHLGWSPPQEDATRMSLCWDTPSERSWFARRDFAMSRAFSDTTLNNNNNSGVPFRRLVTAPGSGVVPSTRKKKRLYLGLGATAMSADSVAFGDEQESIL